MNEQAAELFVYFEGIKDNENYLRTVIILQQLKFISRSYALLNQLQVAAKENVPKSVKKCVAKPKPSKAAKRKFED